MIINHNLSSMFASRQLNVTGNSLTKTMEKLSSGESINRAGDNASGLAVSEKMRSQIRGLNQASRNIGDGISMAQVAEGYMQESTDILQRIRELAVQSANGVFSDEDRAMIQVEVSQLVAEVDRIASTAQFNGMSLLTGRFAENGIQFQVGANADQNFSIKINSLTASDLGLKGAQGSDESISIATTDEANLTIATVDNALKTVLSNRASLGAAQNRMETAQKGIQIAAENTQSAESRIRDSDMAEQVVDYTKNLVLSQAGTAMLSQANSQSQNVLALLTR